MSQDAKLGMWQPNYLGKITFGADTPIVHAIL
jgi:hypothetical protein